jgi:hypothetical protein
MPITLRLNECTGEVMLKCFDPDTDGTMYVPVDNFLDYADTESLTGLLAETSPYFGTSGTDLIIGLAASDKLGLMQEVENEAVMMCAVQALCDPNMTFYQKCFFFNMTKRFDLTLRQQKLLTSLLEKVSEVPLTPALKNQTAH